MLKPKRSTDKKKCPILKQGLSPCFKEILYSQTLIENLCVCVSVTSCINRSELINVVFVTFIATCVIYSFTILFPCIYFMISTFLYLNKSFYMRILFWFSLKFLY